MGYLELPKNTWAVFLERVAANQLVDSRAYWITDKDQVAVATGPNTYVLFERTSQKNVANGYAGLDASGKLLLGQMPGGVIEVGDVIYSTRNPGAKYLRLNGAKYLKTSYSALAAAMRPSRRAMEQVQQLLPTSIAGFEFAQGGAYLIAFAGITLYRYSMATGVVDTFTIPLGTANYVPKGAFYHNGLFYIARYVNNTIYIQSFNPVTGVFAQISHNLATAGVLGTTVPNMLLMVLVNGFVYVSGGGSPGLLCRAAFSASTWTFSTIPAIASCSSEVVADQNGTLWVLAGSAASGTGFVGRSEDNGVTWTTILLSNFPGVSPGGTQNYVLPDLSVPIYGRSLVSFGGRVFLRLAGYGTTPVLPQAIWMMPLTGNIPTLVANPPGNNNNITPWVGTSSSTDSWVVYAGHLLSFKSTSSFADGFAINEYLEQISTADVAEQVGLAGSMITPDLNQVQWNEEYGGFRFLNAYLYKYPLGYNFQTEFKVPLAKTQNGIDAYIRALP